MDVSEQLVNALAAVDVQEFTQGQQSRAFRIVDADGSTSVAKVLDASMVECAELDARLVVTTALADLDSRVCRPLPIDGHLAIELTDTDGHNWYIVRYEFAAGRALEPGNAEDATRMGMTLSRLHSSMSRLELAPLPLVAALRTAPPDAMAGAASHQLLHGDFNASNLRESGGEVRIFDFDDCGYGPAEFDVATRCTSCSSTRSHKGTPRPMAYFDRRFSQATSRRRVCRWRTRRWIDSSTCVSAPCATGSMTSTTHRSASAQLRLLGTQSFTRS